MAQPSITVIDYGMGNLRSVAKALELVGADVRVSGEASSILSADAVVFPGVGSFGPAIANLEKSALVDVITSVVHKGKPFMGMCLGFQMLFARSEEEGEHRGLGIIPGDVLKFDFRGDKTLKVPHMGWNTVRIADTPAAQTMFRGIADNSYFYFVHSYYGKPAEAAAMAGVTEYGIPFCAAVAIGSTWACQFHPEKSGATGLQLLKNYVDEVKTKC